MTTDPPNLKIDSLARLVARAIPVLLILAVMLAAWFALERILSGHSSEELAAEPASERSLSDTLTLPKGKLRAGEFESAEVELRAVQHRHTVPGRIRYDETKHVEVQAPMDGVVDKVLVTPGESVACGQRLAVLRSPEIGKARADVLDQKARRDIAQRILDRELAISKNLEQLSQMLDGQEPIAAIEAAFADRSLGSYREPLMAGYARLLLATDLHEQVQPLGGSGSISGRTIRERQAERQISAAAYRTAKPGLRQSKLWPKRKRRLPTPNAS